MRVEVREVIQNCLDSKRVRQMAEPDMVIETWTQPDKGWISRSSNISYKIIRTAGG